MLNLKDMTLGFIGAGNMASAIVNGIIGTKTFPANRVFIFDIHKDKCENLKTKTGIQVANSVEKLTETCDIIFLAVKPQNFAEVLAAAKAAVNERKLFVSIAAGISSGYITDSLNCVCLQISRTISHPADWQRSNGNVQNCKCV